MKRLVQLTAFLLIASAHLFAQSDSVSATDRFGVMANIDLGINFSDQVFKENSERRISVGAAYTNKQRKFISFLGFGVRLFKYTYNSPDLKSSFIQDLNANYTPVEQGGFDSLVGAAMSKGGSFWGTSGGWIYASFTWNNKFRPTLEFYFGGKGINSHGNGFTQYTDPEYKDIDYASLKLKYYELKFGCSPPFINKHDWPFTANLNLGYRLSDYGGFLINNVPMSSYTNPNFVNKYRFSSSFTLSLSIRFWSNWVW